MGSLCFIVLESLSPVKEHAEADSDWQPDLRSVIDASKKQENGAGADLA